MKLWHNDLSYKLLYIVTLYQQISLCYIKFEKLIEYDLQHDVHYTNDSSETFHIIVCLSSGTVQLGNVLLYRPTSHASVSIVDVPNEMPLFEIQKWATYKRYLSRSRHEIARRRPAGELNLIILTTLSRKLYEYCLHMRTERKELMVVRCVIIEYQPLAR